MVTKIGILTSTFFLLDVEIVTPPLLMLQKLSLFTTLLLTVNNQARQKEIG